MPTSGTEWGFYLFQFVRARCAVFKILLVLAFWVKKGHAITIQQAKKAMEDLWVQLS